MADRESEDSRRSDLGQARVDHLAWILGAGSALIVFALIGYLLYEALGGPPAVTDLTVEKKATVQRGAVYYVDIVARNSGGASAAGVVVEGAIIRNAVTLETSRFRLDYVPARSKAEGTLLFRNDPRSDRLELEVKSFSKP